MIPYLLAVCEDLTRVSGLFVFCVAHKWLAKAMGETGITILDLSPAIATDACGLPGEFHKDPTDRIIVATARVHNFRLVTKDQKIIEYPHVRSFG